MHNLRLWRSFGPRLRCVVVCGVDIDSGPRPRETQHGLTIFFLDSSVVR